jgi:hypothetical protein
MLFNKSCRVFLTQDLSLISVALLCKENRPGRVTINKLTTTDY